MYLRHQHTSSSSNPHQSWKAANITGAPKEPLWLCHLPRTTPTVPDITIRDSQHTDSRLIASPRPSHCPPAVTRTRLHLAWPTDVPAVSRTDARILCASDPQLPRMAPTSSAMDSTDDRSPSSIDAPREEESREGRVRKRRRLVISCSECHRRKQKVWSPPAIPCQCQLDPRRSVLLIRARVTVRQGLAVRELQVARKRSQMPLRDGCADRQRAWQDVARP